MVEGATTHSFEELKNKVNMVRVGAGDIRGIQERLESLGAIDPFRDGKAVDRFRDLLSEDSSRYVYGKRCLQRQ